MKQDYMHEIKKYFRNKAAQYDEVDRQLYWRLSDELLKLIIKRKIAGEFRLKRHVRILDAGAGTGRWSLILFDLLNRKNVKLDFDLLDITKEMLNQAEIKIKKRNLQDTFRVREKNIEDLSDCPDEIYDIALSYYNVLSFTTNPKRAIKEVFKKLKKRGIYTVTVANKYHSYFFNALTDRASEFETIFDKSKIRFNKKMPYIHCFTPNGLKKIFQDVGFKEVIIIGFPNFIYPNIEDTYILGQSQKNRNILQDKAIFDKILNVEYSECFNSDLAARGNSLLVIARK